MISERHVGHYKDFTTLCSLNLDDKDRRLRFAEDFLSRVTQTSTFPRLVMWSNEVIVKINIHVNKHNAIYYSATNPHRTMVVAQQAPGLMVWCWTP